MVYSVLVAHFYELEYQQGHWVLGSHSVLTWRYCLICRVSRGGNNALESLPSVCPLYFCKLCTALRGG